ncbi:hypothetical protein TYRP_016331 [Tyrophagus putrescentiae]|nr:hypothetical protein TYRP_016331 [Tyrophagus putrescentiae]
MTTPPPERPPFRDDNRRRKGDDGDDEVAGDGNAGEEGKTPQRGDRGPGLAVDERIVGANANENDQREEVEKGKEGDAEEDTVEVVGGAQGGDIG